MFFALIKGGSMMIQTTTNQTKTKTLLHISYQPWKLVSEFTPRIPYQRAYGEDNKFKRVCVADTIDNCLIAAPFTDEMFEPNGYVEKGEMDIYLSGENSGVPFVAYEIEAPISEVWSPGSISRMVPDALETNEHWFTTTVKPKSHRYDLLEDVNVALKKVFYKELTEEEFLAHQRYENS